MRRTSRAIWWACAAIACAACKGQDSQGETAGSAVPGESGGTITASAGGAAGDGGSAGSGGSAGGTPGVPDGSEAGTGGAPVDGGSVLAEGSLAEVAPAVYTSSQRQSHRPLGSTTSLTGYLEYLPLGYEDGVKRPLLVVAPGITENGNGTTDLDKLLVRGPPKLIAENRWPDERPFVVLSMQHLADAECASGREVHDFIAYALGQYAIDLDHVYLTGISCGAISTWNYIGSYGAEQIAAAVPIAGNGNPAWSTAGCRLGAVAIWAFHDQGDQIIPFTGTTTPIDNLAMCMPPGREAKKTIYASADHDSWTRTYDLTAGNDIYTWMLSKSR